MKLILGDLEKVPPIALILLGFFALVWLTLQFLKFRRESRSRTAREVANAWTEIAELKKKGLSAEDFQQARDEIRATIGAGNRAPETSAEMAPGEGEAQEVPRNRIIEFLSALFQFGFLGSWSLGWGAGWGFWVFSAAGDAWYWAAGPENVVTTLWRFGVLVLASLFLIGLWVIPTLFSLFIAIGGGCRMITAIGRCVWAERFITKLNNVMLKLAQVGRF